MYLKYLTGGRNAKKIFKKHVNIFNTYFFMISLIDCELIAYVLNNIICNALFDKWTYIENVLLNLQNYFSLSANKNYLFSCILILFK